MPKLNFAPTSALSSAQVVPYTSAVNLGADNTFLVIILIIPPIASEPYSEDAGPFTTSILSIKALGIPLNPYTVDNELTIGIPSIKTIV